MAEVLMEFPQLTMSLPDGREESIMKRTCLVGVQQQFGSVTCSLGVANVPGRWQRVPDSSLESWKLLSCHPAAGGCLPCVQNADLRWGMGPPAAECRAVASSTSLESDVL